MKFKSVLATAAAMSLMVAPTFAVAKIAPVAQDEAAGEGGGIGTGVVVAVLAAAAVVAGIVVATDNNDSPASP